MYGDEFCNKFFKRIDDNFCVNWDFNGASMSGKQWCYVSPQCKELGDGNLRLSQDKTRQIAYKTCTDKDQKLVMKKPYELAQLAEKADLDLGILTKWAYPVPGKVSTSTEADRNRTRDSPYATMWDSDDGHPPFSVVSANGTSQFVIDYRPSPDGKQAYMEGRMGKVNGLVCLPQFGPCCGASTGAECPKPLARAWGGWFKPKATA